MKTALVTGAGKGLGAGFVRLLGTEGYFVYAGVRSVAGFTNADNLEYIELDVTSDDSIQKALRHIQEKHGTLDLVVNNAGLNKDSATGGIKEKAAKLDSLDRRVLLTMFDVNAVGPVMVAKYALPLMAKPGSFIINISSNRASFSDDTNTSGNYGYRASKTALNMLTRCLLFDLPKNVSVFAVHPGSVKTDMNPHGTLAPVEAAELIMRIPANWNSRLNGAYLHNDGSLFN